MKKEFKISLIIICAILGAIAVVFLVIVGNLSKNPNEISTQKKLDYSIVCEALNDVKYSRDNFFVTNKGEIYLFDLYKKYSKNDSNCIKIDSNKIGKIIQRYFVDENNNFYILQDENLNFINEDDKDFNTLMKSNEYIMASYITTIDYPEGYFYVLKSDNKVYKVYLNGNTIIKEEMVLFYENEIIIDFEIGNETHGYDRQGEFIYVKTNKSYYISEINNKNECETYVDIQCKYELVKDEYLTNNYDDISFINSTYKFVMKNGEIYIKN